MLVLEIIACESTPIYNFWCEDILEIAVKLHLTVFCGILFVVLHYSCTVGFVCFDETCLARIHLQEEEKNHARLTV